MRRDAGQASVEYVAVVGLVGLVLAGAVALTSGGLGRWVVWAWGTALCHVTGGECPDRPGDRADLEPCPLSEDDHEQGGSLGVAVLRLGRRLGLRTQAFSDGHVEVTFGDDGSGGLTAGLGGHVKVAGVSVSREVSAEVDWNVSAGTMWSFPNAAAAAAFVKKFGSRQTLGGRALHIAEQACLLCRLFGHGPPPLPPADETTYEHGTAVVLGAEVASGWGLAAEADLAHQMLGVRVDQGGGGAVYLRSSDSGRIAASLLAGANATVAAEGAIEVDYDAEGEPTAIVLHRVRRAAVGVAGAGGFIGATAAEGTVEEVETVLDAPSPADVRAALALVASHPPDDALVADITTLSADLRRRAVINTRRYALRLTHGEVAAGVEAGLVAEAGLEAGGEHLRLLGQSTRFPGLPTLPRGDCHAPAA